MIVDDEQKDAARGFDPRYDPQFQRGYRPQPGEQPRTRVRTAPAPDPAGNPQSERAREDDRGSSAEAAALSVNPAALPHVAPGAVDAPSGAPVSPAPADQTAERPELVRAYAVPAPSLLDRLDLSPRRNPLMLALWIVGAGLVVLGIVLYSVSVSISYTGSTPSSDVGSLVISQLGWMLAGPMITIGLATLVALLFLTALAGRRPRSVPFGDDSVDGRLGEDGDRLR
ncbi:hypothetical protein KNO15_07785 [Leifsonia shinshuensis]|uniref:hypothetical protein n=1 Tax=Leifsonia shinshuensis TaxID=150026 RepID=UPI001F51397B|nr:hypothetical protein [Leifsonia shinshuensis]MCI0156594.1 hypothetical protein [Leifsonia shinshuensis]